MSAKCCSCSHEGVTSHEVSFIRDGVLWWTCDECGYAWPSAAVQKVQHRWLAEWICDSINESRELAGKAALMSASRRIFNGAGDPEQALYDYGAAPWLEERASEWVGRP